MGTPTLIKWYKSGIKDEYVTLVNIKMLNKLKST
jgi:hypothetical protein